MATKLSPCKCNVLSLGMAHVKHLYNSCDVLLLRVSQMTDLGILIDDQLSFSSHIDDQLSFSPHIAIVCTKANSVPQLC